MCCAEEEQPSPDEVFPPLLREGLGAAGRPAPCTTPGGPGLLDAMAVVSYASRQRRALLM